jgi:DNA-binding LacI/PurR family transcriptional regulator
MKAWHQVTIHDVAKQAKVSTSTVSKFLNGNQKFSTEVEKRITDIVKKLGYQQNPMAQSMATGKTGMIGFAIMDIYNPNFAMTIKGATREAVAHNYNLLVIDLEESKNRQHQIEAVSRRVDGLILNVPIHMDWLSEIKKPLIILGMSDTDNITTVRANGYNGAVLAAEHIVNIGRKRLAYVGYPEVLWNKYRIRGILKALKNKKIDFDVWNVDSLNVEAGRKISQDLFSGKNRPDAVIACNDLLAIGVMHGAREMGLSIPEDVAVMGFDNIILSNYVYPPLTTIDMHAEQVGEMAIRKMLEMIKEKIIKPEKILLQPNLIIRGSTVVLPK